MGLGSFIRRVRCDRGKSLQDVLGESYAYLSRVERGEANPSLEVLGRIARGLGMELVIGFRDRDTLWYTWDVFSVSDKVASGRDIR